MDAAVNAPSQARVDELVRAQARRTPDAVAAICGAHSLTYRELGRQSARAAGRLRALGATRDTLVGIHLERSLEMLVAVLAVMESGAAYVPLDPDFPPDRLAHMVGDARLSIIINQASLADGTPAGEHASIDIRQLLDVGGHGGEAANDEGVATLPAAASDLAYVLYTSGSTGLPKGVAVEHRNVANFLLSMQREPGLDAGDRLLAVTTLSFDIAGLELYLPLVAGATVVIASRDDAIDGERLDELLRHHQVTVMQATPTTWRMLIEAGWRGGPGFKALCGGEALPRDLARMLLQRCGQLWNLYGPTETTIWSTVFAVTDPDAQVLIGRPIDNTRVYVLDRAGRPTPTGIPGELCIAGAGVARGYLNRPELTAEKFVIEPFADGQAQPEGGGGRVPRSRMYRTGDSARFLPDGNLEFRHRIDNQIKIRGFRVELGEVEAALESHAAVKQAVARTFELRPGDTRLVAYVLPTAAAPATNELREHLRARLPHYMVPQHLTVVAGFALTPNGKVDRSQLPEPDAGDLVTEQHVEPESAVERSIVEVFGDLLGIERVSADASFFDLGGHSILATRAVTRLRAEHHPGMSLRMLFESPTAIELAREIDQLQQRDRPGIQRDAADRSEREAFQF